MIIDWYPGHMKTAREQIIKALPSIDLFIEVLDARLPQSSANPLLEKLRGNKPCIKVLNKKDLADPEVTREWVSFFDSLQGVKAIPLEAKDRRDVGPLPKLCRKLAPNRGGKGQRPLRVMIVGIPNVGKSTLINTLAGKKIARVGDKPAITTCPQQIDLRNGILLSDTPGLLWPVLADKDGASRLAASGAIGDNAYDSPAIALTTADYLLERYPQFLLQRYKLTERPASPSHFLEELGRRRGCLVGGGEVDLTRAAELFLRELRSGKLGRISLERPGEVNPATEAPAEEETEP
ncbi:ribosome biogenesis GTPase A [Desulfuromonas versatilis]|uniref:Ribosome biogenesis GTPase A n=1 Tax=Desulfuromonas versatilis TaxID=2802975 RepID=A0ABM8HVW4_9BACT|nr:ribosome biogenesis GTPase YlqF [Desulfuromonas versatilis]BCR04696.1 ribosome biogenesis GTPase A [Desulfuromonas versatilis]